MDRTVSKIRWRDSRASKELVLIIVVGAGIFVFMAYYDIFEHYRAWVEKYGLKVWQLDDAVFLLAYFGFAFGLYAFLRMKELRLEMAARRKAEKHKDEFLRMVSHELRTPMTTIREGVTQVLDGIHGPTTEAQREFLGIVQEDTERLSRIINNVLDISKIEAGKLEIRKEHVDMIRIARQVAKIFKPQADAKSLQIKTDFSGSTIEAYVDPDTIFQVWNNLVGNALKFTKQGHVELSVTERETLVICTVKDTGEGMRTEDIPKIFNKFYQATRTRGPGEKGTGLGLPIAKAIVESHGGTLSAESVLGQGSIFTFAIPKAPI